MKIERAVREKTYTLTSIAGPSGSGKTYSAILYARGLVGPEGKIGFIDTENKRSRFYADVAGGFDVIDLDPPFTSARYIEAIKTFEDAGYGAIVIDSISHEWEGTGGVLEQADAIEQQTKRAGLHCWAKPKGGHKKLMNELLQTRTHLIFCCRVKEKVVQAKVNGKTEIVNEGFVVVQEKMFIYEMTVSLMLAEGSHLPTILKCPGDLIHAFPENKLITTDVGEAMRAWSDQGVAVDPEVAAKRREGLLAANGGMESLKQWWDALGAWQKRLEGMKDTFKSIATAADQLKQDIADAGGTSIGDRLAQSREATGHSGTGEGFDLNYVKDELNSSSGSPSGDDSAESSPPPPKQALGATSSEAADQDAGQTEQEKPTSASPDFDKKWLTTLAAVMATMLDKTEREIVDEAKKHDQPLASTDARAKARAIVDIARRRAVGDVDTADAMRDLAATAGCTVAEIRP